MNGREIIKHITKSEMPDMERVRENCLRQTAVETAHKKTGFARVRPAFIVAALVVLVSATTVLAATFKWNEALISYFNPNEKQIDEMADSVDAPEATLTENGVTVNVLQTIATDREILVLYEMIAPEGIVLSDDINWHNSDGDLYFTTSDETDDINLSSSKVWSSYTLKQEGNKRTVLIRMSLPTPLGDDLTAHLQFGDLERSIDPELYNSGVYNNDDLVYDSLGRPIGRVAVIKGEWDLTWKFCHDNANVKTIHPNTPISINGRQYVISDIEITPFSVTVRVPGEGILDELRPVAVSFKNGGQRIFNILDDDFLGENYTAFVGGDAGYLENELCNWFQNMIDINDVESVTLRDVTVPIVN